MTLVREVVDEVSGKVHSFTAVRESLTSLVGDLDDTATSFNVADPERISTGLVEIDSELMYVNVVEGAAVQLFPFGRGYESSLATTHSDGAKVVNDPVYPRKAILRALQNASDMCGPELFKAGWIEFSRTDGPQGQYTLPEGTTSVRSVQLVRPGWPSLDATSWDFRTNAGGAFLRCFEAIGGSSLSVLYSSPVTAPVTEDDDLDTLGWTDVRDVIVWGACWQLLQSQEPGRLDLASVAQSVQSDIAPVGSATKVAQQFYAGFAQRKQDTLRVLNKKYPIQIHRRA